MKKNLVVLLALLSLVSQAASLRFDASRKEVRNITMPNGERIVYTAWEGIYYVTNVEDSTYQTLNFYFPDRARANAPIFLRTYVGGYMAAAAKAPSADDATGRALQEGYAVCIPGARGSNSVVTREQGKGKKKKTVEVYTGRMPNALLDLKAAIRYLRYNDDLMPGDASVIITDGTSAGGAMSALLGTAGDHPFFEPMLEAMGAAQGSDAVQVAVCYCPITDLDHADAAYEWLYAVTNDAARALTDEQKALSQQLAEMYPSYINSLRLTNPSTGAAINSDNYLDYVKSWLVASAQRAQNEGVDLPDAVGIVRFDPNKPVMGMLSSNAEDPLHMHNPFQTHTGLHGVAAAQRAQMTDALNERGLVPQNAAGQGRPAGFATPKSEFIADIDLMQYLNYVVQSQPLKSPPAFDSKGVLGAPASFENRVYGDATGADANFTAFGAAMNGTSLDPSLARLVRMTNPMTHIGSPEAKCAEQWYIRHGARDRDTSFCVPVNLATKLMNAGADVNFALPWNRPHSGDYNLDDLFNWLNQLIMPQ